VTRKALEGAPGLDICGVIHEFDWDEDCLGEMNRQKEFERVRASRPSPTTRFLRLPVVTECATSGLPASDVYNTRDGKELRSQVTQAKRKFVGQAVKRLYKLLRQRTRQESDNFPIKISDSIYALENNFHKNKGEKINWLSVIHADGNGLGEIFMNFHKHIDSGDTTANKNRDYVQKLRRFSLALDVCTERAFLRALAVFFADRQQKKLVVLPLVPLVLGGDDLTVVCDGQYALRFTQTFLESFERETASDHMCGIIPELATKALGKPRLSACAGVAIIKSHFPFSVAYLLAEESSAKVVKKKLQNSDKNNVPFPCSALDFHILYDASGVELDQIREKLDLDAHKNQLWGGPYIITKAEDLRGASNWEWSQLHRWEKLISRVNILQTKDDEGKRLLPNSQMHDLREGLFLGKIGADAKLQLIYERYEKQGLAALVEKKEEPRSLFWQESAESTIINGLSA